MELALRTTTSPRSEQALVDAARGGDDHAFEQLYALYRERITAFIHSKVHDHGRAEDISQEVFIAALRQLRRSDQPIAFKPWIFTIAKNACIDEHRRCARGREFCVETDDACPADERSSLSVVPSPPAAIESKQRLEDLQGAFGGLSESHHRLIVMRELEGRSYDEIGNRLGMTRQGVESGLFRARRKLSEEYVELASGRRCEQVQSVVDRGALSLRALGIKERRRLTQHLSHCRACRQQARLAGVDETLLKPRSIRSKIAALVPFGGLWRWPWRRGASRAARTHGAAHVAASGAVPAAGTVGSSITLGQAAAAVAALAIAGAGGGIAVAQHSDHGHRSPAGGHHSRGTGAGTAASPASAAATSTGSAGSAGTSPVTGRAATPTARSRVTAKGSATGGARTKGTGASSPPSPQEPSTAAGSASSTSTTGAPKTSASSASPTTTLPNTTTNTPGHTESPVKTVTHPVAKATNPVSAPVTSVVKTVTAPVTSVVKTVTAPVTSGPVTTVVKTVTPPVTSVVKTVTAPVTTVTAPVNTVTAPVTKVVTSVTKAVSSVTATPPAKSVTTPATPPVSSVTTTVNKVLGGP